MPDSSPRHRLGKPPLAAGQGLAYDFTEWPQIVTGTR